MVTIKNEILPSASLRPLENSTLLCEVIAFLPFHLLQTSFLFVVSVTSVRFLEFLIAISFTLYSIHLMVHEINSSYLS